MERRTLTPAEIQYQHIGSTRIAPGIWQDAAGDIHFSIVELLALVDLADTVENRERVFQLVEESVRAANPAMTLIRQDPA